MTCTHSTKSFKLNNNKKEKDDSYNIGLKKAEAVKWEMRR